MKTAKQMFGAVTRQLAATERAMREDAADSERRIVEEQDRLDETLTRREVIEALESVASVYSSMDGHDTRDLLRRLVEALS